MKTIRELLRNWQSKKNETFGMVATVNALFGLWPDEDDDFSLRFRCGISTVAVTAMLVQTTYDSYLNCTEIANNTGNLFSVLCGLVGLSKIICFYKYRDLLRTNVVSAVNDWSKEYSKDAIAIMSNCKRVYEKFVLYYITIGYWMSLMHTIVTYAIAPDVTITVATSAKGTHERNVTTMLRPRFQVTGSCMFGNISQPTYWSIVVIQFIQAFIVVGVMLGADGFFLAITSHLSAQFEILKMKFTECLKRRDSAETRKNLGVLIARHEHLLNLAKQLETSFSGIALTQLLTSLCTLDVAGVNLLVLQKHHEMISELTNVGIVHFSLVQAFLYCYIGEKLSSQGDDIALSVYASEWYSVPPSISRNVMLVMTRTRLPIGISGGNFFKVSHSTFADMIKTALSYLSFLRIKIIDNH